MYKHYSESYLVRMMSTPLEQSKAIRSIKDIKKLSQGFNKLKNIEGNLCVQFVLHQKPPALFVFHV